MHSLCYIYELWIGVQNCWSQFTEC